MIFWAVVIALVLAVALLTPFLLKELRKGQSQSTDRKSVV